jgi:SAM-dependent methyltransferase
VTSGRGASTWEEAVVWLKSQPDQEPLIKACFFDDPLLDAAKRYYSSSEWQAVRQLLPLPTGRALDIGSGRGISAYALVRDGWVTTALEPDPSRIVGAAAIRELAAESHSSIDVVETWGEALPFEDGSFDVVHARQVLHHARDLRQLCREISRVLKPNGRMIATREHVISRKEDLVEFQKQHPLHHLYGGENAFLLEEYLGAIQDAGIHLTQVLNPFESDINVYPQTLQSVKVLIAKKLRMPSSLRIPNILLSWRGRLTDTPGRLYTFFGFKET